MSKIAVIDLGSNTFHLMIVAEKVGGFDILLKERIFVGLAEGGGKIIKPEKIQAGIEACQFFKHIVAQNEVRKIKIIGTAVLRSSENRHEMISACEQIFDTKVEIIQGKREADLIYKGVSLIDPLDDSLIMDIGGGSVEFIITKMGKIVWSESFPIGLGPLYEFHKSDPISLSETNNVMRFISNNIYSLYEAIDTYKPKELIGASGTFEVVEDTAIRPSKKGQLTRVDIETVKDMVEQIIHSTYEERLKIKSIPIQRATLIVVAMILIKDIIIRTNPDAILISPYALKEGIIKELLLEK